MCAGFGAFFPDVTGTDAGQKEGATNRTARPATANRRETIHASQGTESRCQK